MSELSRYNIKETEEKWQNLWSERKCFEVTEDPDKEKYYVLEMLPYPSGNLHVGHVRNYTLGDVVARYKTAKGFNVMHPMGWDAFGLPAENAAMERGLHPAKWTHANISVMRSQLKSIGLSIDWSREFATCDAEYYRHEQKMFLDFYEKGIAYRKESVVNWDPVDNTVLANEQVIDGKGWRTGAAVERRKLNQWFLKITDYAQELLDDLEKLDKWPEKVRIMQKNWIGKSKGLQFKWDIAGTDDQIEVFTTRPDTLFGASFMALASDHPIASKLAGDKDGFEDFIKQCQSTGTSEAAIEQADKIGFDTGCKATHPLLPGKEFPIYIANFILMDYGTGAVFGVPAHDQRDFEFATKYNLPILPVISPLQIDNDTKEESVAEAYIGPGNLINSEFLNGMDFESAKITIIEKCEEINNGFGTIQYRLRDWGVSRQRYWGCPIPIVYCDACGAVPVPKQALPVTLPDDVSFDEPGNPLENHPTWKHTACPECDAEALRETDTFDTFFESSWYQFRYCDPDNENSPIDKDKADYWMSPNGVDQYIGGVEHAVLHLLYARFFTKAMRDCNYINTDEPFKGLFTQGMVTHVTFKDKDGKWLFPDEIIAATGGVVKKSDGSSVAVGRIEKMSKSKKNVVDPKSIIEIYGADSARLFILSDSPPERDLEWTESGIEGAWRYINKLYRMFKKRVIELPNIGSAKPANFTDEAINLRNFTHKTIKGVSEDIEAFTMNKAVARLRELTNVISTVVGYGPGEAWALREGLEALAKMLNPMMPHLAEELWSILGYESLLADEDWPQLNESLLIGDTVTIGVQVNGKRRASITLAIDADQKTAEDAAISEPGVQRALKGKQIRKVIVVPGKIVNVVVS